MIDKQTEKQAPLWQVLKDYRKLDRASFHTPGHKGANFFPHDLLCADLTELPETDALYEANGAILACEHELSRLYGSKRSLISAGGCTLAIQAMLRLACTGGRLLCSRILHRSAVNTMALLGIEPIWLMPEQQSGCSGRISAESVKEALRKDKSINAVYITSPDYYGALSDVKGISEVCREYDIPLLVDNAHGSHLAFLKKNLHPLHLGASMTACSMHKTLPVLTGGAVLNINNTKYVSEAKAAMSLFGSTSPSYPVMCSIDLCTQWLLNGGAEAYSQLEETIKKIKTIANERGISQPFGLCDPLRVSLNTASVGMSGQEGGDYFRRLGLEPEMFDDETVVFICTPFNTSEELERLSKAIINLPKASPLEARKTENILPKQAISLREAVLAPNEKVKVEKAAERIAAETACPCPPGIPLVMPGEIIDRDCVNRLIQSGIYEIAVVKNNSR